MGDDVLGGPMRGFNGANNLVTDAPCMAQPADVTTKTVGLAPCPDCHCSDCWVHYLRWESSRKIDLNKRWYCLVGRKIVDEIPTNPAHPYVRASAIRDAMCEIPFPYGAVVVNDL